MPVLQSKMMAQSTVDMFNSVRGREQVKSASHDCDIPPRVVKMTLKDLRIMQANVFKIKS